jgi:hypothetical protein
MSDGAGGWQCAAGRADPGGTAPRRAGAARQSRRPRNPQWLPSMQRGSASTDTWVITEGAVDRTSAAAAAADGRTSWPAGTASSPAAAAENLFWLGRYTERAENSVRLARLALEALRHGSEPVLEVLHGWRCATAWSVPGCPAERGCPGGAAVRARADPPCAWGMPHRGLQRGLQPARAATVRPGPARAPVHRALEAHPRGGQHFRSSWAVVMALERATSRCATCWACSTAPPPTWPPSPVRRPTA